MGLDASVMCNCYARGLTTTPPYRECVRVDDEGYLGLDLPWESHRAEHDAFDNWMGSACAHENMAASSERISNWSGYRSFQEALALVGWEQFPTLHAVLPNANGGLVSAADSARCLEELRTFEEHYRARVPTLFDSDTAAIIFQYIQAYNGVFIDDGKSGVSVGLDERGLFVLEFQTRRELFRAMRFEQRPVAHDGAELVDLDTGARLTIALRIHGHEIPWPDGRMQDDQERWRFSEPERMHVARHEQSAADFQRVLTSLRAVFTASVDNSNPVRWC